jgi:hypothetical protein
MEPRRAAAQTVSASDEAAQNAELIEKGNELLNKAKEVARRIEERCRDAMRANPDRGKRPPSKPA